MSAIAFGPGWFITAALYGLLARRTASILPGMVLRALGDLGRIYFGVPHGAARLNVVNRRKVAMRSRERHRHQPAPRAGGLAASLFALAAALAPSAALAERQPQADDAVEAAARTFLDAFDALDMPRFLDAFADDATILHPPAEPPRTFPTRLQGKAEIARTFGVVFDEIRRASGKSAPPYQRITPQDLLVQHYGDVAVLTFHLGTDVRRGRRTLVFRRIGSAWKIVHLHASVFETGAR